MLALPASANQTRSSVTARARGLGARIGQQYSRAINGFSARLTTAQLQAVRADAAVSYVVPDSVVHTDATQTPAVWGLDRTDQRSLPLNNSYTYTSTGAGVTAYVIDTGIRLSHHEFGGRAVAGYTAIGDGNGTNDCNGHGTHVAGTIGGATYGIAKGARLVAVRVLDCSGSGLISGVIAGIDWVTANHAASSVANMSLGSGANQALDDAVTRSIGSGVTYAVAAGNEQSNACQKSPARAPAAITVGATTRSDSRDTDYSNYGPCLDLFAPGTEITSSWNSSDTATNTIRGTSMATPHVTGVAALYLQQHPGTAPALVRDALVNQATPNVVTNAGSGSPNRLLYSGSTVVVPPQPTGDRLLNGQSLQRGQQLCSSNGYFCLTQQAADGNLVLYRSGGRALWSTARPAALTLMQTDGNLVSYDASGRAVWATNTDGNGPSTFVVQTDANLVIYRNSDGRATWSSNTVQPIPPTQPSGTTDRLLVNQGLLRGGRNLTSADGRYLLTVQTDGNLVLHHNGVGAIWASGTRDAEWFTNQGDGNLVLIRANGQATWASQTDGRGAGTLLLQNDGNLVLYRNSDGRATWATHTDGR
jgi:hypothetical protein